MFENDSWYKFVSCKRIIKEFDRLPKRSTVSCSLSVAEGRDFPSERNIPSGVQRRVSRDLPSPAASRTCLARLSASKYICLLCLRLLTVTTSTLHNLLSYLPLANDRVAGYVESAAVKYVFFAFLARNRVYN